MSSLPETIPETALRPGASSELSIAGPAGRLEALLATPKQAPIGLCVVCHPHPLFGGTMANKVVWTLGNAALKAGCRVVRFNFRGVGRSSGLFDDTLGETDDALAVIEALRATAPALPLVIAGFSFGGHVALKAASRTACAALVTVAPPMGRYLKTAEPPAHPQVPWLAVHSADDDTVSYAETHAAMMRYDPPPEFIHYDDAGHFFHGRLGELQAQVQGFLESVLRPA